MGGSGSGNKTHSIRPRRAPVAVAEVVAEEQDEQDLLRLARRDFKKYGAVTREDRIALASRFVRHSDPMIALQYSKLLEQMERGADSVETGLPPPTSVEEQAQRISRLMSMVGKPTTDQAYELFLTEWRERETQQGERYRSSLPTVPGDAESATAPSGPNGGPEPNGVDERPDCKSERTPSVRPEPVVPEPDPTDDFDFLSELQRTAQDYGPAARAQSQVEAGEPGAAGEEGRVAEVLRPPVVEPVRVPWNPNYDGAKYVEDDDGDPE